MKLSLAMIVKNEADYLDACLKSVSDHVDEIIIVDTGSTDDTKKIAAKYGSKIYDFKWVDDFSAPRNFSFSKATGDFILWLDADDVVQHAEKLREVCNDAPKEIDVIFLNYDYEVAADGRVVTKHWRERLFRNNGSITWKGRLHETPVDTRRTGKARNEEVNIVHTAKPSRWSESSERNLRILTKQLEDETGNPDPRTLFYLAAAHKGAGNFDNAKDLYKAYLKLSGWDEERSAAYIQLAEIYMQEQRQSDAIQAYLNSIKERPDLPMGYIGLGEVYALAGNNQRAIDWLKMALSKPEPMTSMVLNPLNYTYKPLIILAECLMMEGKLDDAIQAVKKAATFRKDAVTDSLMEDYTRIKEHKETSESVLAVAKYLDQHEQRDKINTLLEVIPKELGDNPLILKLRKAFTEPKKWAKKSVVIFTGPNVLGEWGPWSLKEGIGGSEEAIIRLSKRLKEQGYDVHVYATPGADSGEYDGVVWHNYWEIDLRDTFDVFIAWRSPWFFDSKVNARKKYLWLHDVMEVGEFTSERLNNLDKVIVLSEYHRSLFPNIPDNKIFLSANGIDADEFDGKEVKRDPHLVVYQSSHVRGLAHIYDVWPEVLKAVPAARLRVMYGWQSFEAVHRDNPERMEWMEKMKRQAEELEGVEDIGKVGQDQIITELLSAGIWAYPCPFPEISCITAMKAQAAGAVPVASNYAALEETIQFGVKMKLTEWNDKTKKEYRDYLIHMLKDTAYQENIRQGMMPRARKLFSWTQVAKDWIAEFES